MKTQRKILLSTFSVSVVIAIILTVVVATRPKVAETADVSSNSSIDSGEQEFEDAIYTEEDFMEGEDLFDLENPDNNQNDNSVNVFDDGDIKVLNKPSGWSANANKTTNSDRFKWPSISPNDLEAGTPITEVPEASSSGAIGSFVFMQKLNKALPFSVECNISGTTITAMLPAGTHLDALVPEFSLNCDKLLYGKTEIKSGKCAFNFTVPIELTAVRGSKKTKYTVYVMTLNTGLPSMAINTADNDDIDSKTEYEKCSVFAGGGAIYNGKYSFATNKYIMANAKIKGRGWTSWYYYPKKSYTLKFDKKQNLLGLPAHTEWVLSANFADRSLIRNAVAMELATSLGSEAVMDVRFVDLWVNGMYAGNYQLIEKIEVSKNRVDITKFDPKLAPDKVGYIIETNGHNRAEGEFGVWTNGQDADRPSKWKKLNENITLDPISGDMFFTSPNYGIIFNINKPSDTKLMALKKNQQLKYLEYIYDYMDKMEKAIKSGSYAEASKYLDMKAMAKWYIVEELAMNTDSKLHCSCYMYKDAGGKMKMGPVWDFDLGFGNGKYANENHSYKTYLDDSTWFASLTQMPEFRNTVKSVWKASKSKIDQLPRFIDKTSDMIEKSQRINFELWSITQPAEHTYERTTEHIDSFNEQIDYLTYFVEDRIDYMNSKIMNW
ncbi:MAG: CotH kinase family protein [Clostridia bacterium]|nr:CotH kinase family protein [Clostridia bacterium]